VIVVALPLSGTLDGAAAIDTVGTPGAASSLTKLTAADAGAPTV
jgi:hypothetical protein